MPVNMDNPLNLYMGPGEVMNFLTYGEGYELL